MQCRCSWIEMFFFCFFVCVCEDSGGLQRFSVLCYCSGLFLTCLCEEWNFRLAAAQLGLTEKVAVEGIFWIKLAMRC